MRRVESGDDLLASDHNDLVDALEASPYGYGNLGAIQSYGGGQLYFGGQDDLIASPASSVEKKQKFHFALNVSCDYGISGEMTGCSARVGEGMFNVGGFTREFGGETFDLSA